MLSIIEMLIPIAEKLFGTIQNAIAAAKQSGELTPEQEAKYQKRLSDVYSQPYALPRPDLPPQPLR